MDWQQKSLGIISRKRQNQKQLIINLKMSVHHQGTKIELKVGKHVEIVDENISSGNAMNDQLKKNQNPEKQAADEKVEKASNEENLRHRVGRLWTELTTLKKVLTVGGVVAVILIAVLLALLAVSLSYKPKIVILRSGSLPLPNSPEVLNYYQVQASRKSLTAKDRNANFTMTTVSSPKTARLLQEDGSEDGEVSALVLTFDYPEEGVTIKATSPVDLIVQYDYDQAIAFYSEHSTSRRLLFELELRAALRQLQDAPLASDPSDTAYTFDDSASIIRDAEQSALRAYAASTSADPSEVEMTYSETTDIVQQADGSFALDSSAKSSRLLTALHGLRGLVGEWTTIFDEINSKVLQARIEETQAAINEFFPNGDAAAAYTEDPELKAVLQASNFNPDNDVDVEEEVTTTARLLQQIPIGADLSSNLISNLSDIVNSGNTTIQQSNQNAQTNHPKVFKRVVPINPKARIGRNNGNHKRVISTSSYDSCVKCTKKDNKTTCETSVLNDQKSPFQVLKWDRDNLTSFNQSIFTTRFTMLFPSSGTNQVQSNNSESEKNKTNTKVVNANLRAPFNLYKSSPPINKSPPAQKPNTPKPNPPPNNKPNTPKPNPPPNNKPNTPKPNPPPNNKPNTPKPNPPPNNKPNTPKPNPSPNNNTSPNNKPNPPIPNPPPNNKPKLQTPNDKSNLSPSNNNKTTPQSSTKKNPEPINKLNPQKDSQLPKDRPSQAESKPTQKENTTQNVKPSKSNDPVDQKNKPIEKLNTNQEKTQKQKATSKNQSKPNKKTDTNNNPSKQKETGKQSSTNLPNTDNNNRESFDPKPDYGSSWDTNSSPQISSSPSYDNGRTNSNSYANNNGNANDNSNNASPNSNTNTNTNTNTNINPNANTNTNPSTNNNNNNNNNNINSNGNDSTANSNGQNSSSNENTETQTTTTVTTTTTTTRKAKKSQNATYNSSANSKNTTKSNENNSSQSQKQLSQTSDETVQQKNTSDQSSDNPEEGSNQSSKKTQNFKESPSKIILQAQIPLPKG